MAKPIFITETSDHEVHLSIQGSASVQHAQEVSEAFVQLLSQHQDVRISFAAVTELDISAVQLTYALRQEVIRQGRQVSIDWPKQANLIELLEKSGIIKMI